MSRAKPLMHNSFLNRKPSSHSIPRVNSGLRNMSVNENTSLLPNNGNHVGAPKKKRTALRNSEYAVLRWPASAIHNLNQTLKRGSESETPFIRWPALFCYKSWLVIKSNYASVLLVFVPLGIVAGYGGWNPTTVFVFNFLAIIPLAALLAFATEELAATLGETLGGLLNSTFGNAVELIVSIVALRDGQIRIVQSSMLGSILSNILLVLGCCFIAGGLKKKEQNFGVTAASTMASLMAVASASLIIPSTLSSTMERTKHSAQHENIMILSHGTAMILLFLYVLYLYFQLYSHAYLFVDEVDPNADDTDNLPSTMAGSPLSDDDEEEEHEVKEGDTLSPIAAGIALCFITVFVALCAEYLVDSIDSIVENFGISKTFIGLILLPIVGNAAEHVTAVVVSYKNKMNLALGVAIGSSMQIALFVTPSLVILGWIMGQPMSLHFETFETVVFFLSVLVVNYLIQDGKSNYLEGWMCLGTYVIIALAFWVYPDEKTPP